MLGGLDLPELEAATEKLIFRLFSAGASVGAGPGGTQGDLRAACAADSISRAAEGSAPLARHRGEGPAQSGGVGRGTAEGAGPGGVTVPAWARGAPRAPRGPA